MERVFLSDLEVFENSAQGSSNAMMRYGGGIMIARSEEVALKRIKMCGNEVGRKKGPENGAMGGAIHLQEVSKAQLHGSSLWQNRSAVKGGTLSVLDVQELSLLGNTIVASYASQEQFGRNKQHRALRTTSSHSPNREEHWRFQRLPVTLRTTTCTAIQVEM